MDGVFIFVLIWLGCLAEEKRMEPTKYGYRLRTDDRIRTAESNVPARGYHVSEGEYYPDFTRRSTARFDNNGEYYPFPGSGTSSLIGRHFMANPGRPGVDYPSNFGRRFTNTPIDLGAHGQQYLRKETYNDGKKQVNDGGFQRNDKEKVETSKEGEEGYKHDKVSVQDAKANEGHYKQQEGERKSDQVGKEYHEGKEYNQEGQNEGEKKHKASHRKGHVIKGFKTHHHKDETGKTEEYYDEKHDEGDESSFHGQSGSFDEKSKTALKGEHDNGVFKSGEQKKEGHYDSKQISDQSSGNNGEYDGKKYYGSGQVYGQKNDIDEQSILGHQEATKIYKPVVPYYVPFD